MSFPSRAGQPREARRTQHSGLEKLCGFLRYVDGDYQDAGQFQRCASVLVRLQAAQPLPSTGLIRRVVQQLGERVALRTPASSRNAVRTDRDRA